MKSLGLYVHIPFCKSKCLYCDFNSFAGKDHLISSYFSALHAEIAAWAKKLSEYTIDTVYFGGGTPSYIDLRLLCDILVKIQSCFKISSDCEITLECNPGTISRQSLHKLRDFGVNRLSIGLQSVDDQHLKKLGRIHTFYDFEACFYTARNAGFDNISFDLMYALPDMTMAEWVKTLEKAVGFDAEHISAYALKIEEGTPFSKMNLNLPDEDLSADMYQKAVDILRNAGYTRYEISNFAKPGRESRHNQKYWQLFDFLGVGAGAYSCLDNTRFANNCDIQGYIDEITKKSDAITEKIAVSLEEQMSEFVFLGLRCERGISLNEFEKRFGVSLLSRFGKQIKKYVNYGFLSIDDSFLRFKDKGFFVSNTILADFI